MSLSISAMHLTVIRESSSFQATTNNQSLHLNLPLMSIPMKPLSEPSLPITAMKPIPNRFGRLSLLMIIGMLMPPTMMIISMSPEIIPLSREQMAKITFPSTAVSRSLRLPILIQTKTILHFQNISSPAISILPSIMINSSSVRAA